MAREATAFFEQFFAVSRIARRLMIQRRTGESGLPDKCCESLNFILRETKLRHLRSWAEFRSVADPVRNPFLAQLLARFFQIRADFFDFLQEVVALLFQRFGPRIHLADLNCEVRGLTVESIGGSVIRRGISLFLETRNVQQVIGFGFRELQYRLTRVDELLVLIVESLKAMATDTAALAVKLLSLVKYRSVLGDHIGGMALLAARVVIFGIVERPKPMLVTAMPPLYGIDCATVSSMTGRTPEFFKRMQCQKFLIGMAGKRSVSTLCHSQVRFRQSDLRRDVLGISANVA